MSRRFEQAVKLNVGYVLISSLTVLLLAGPALVWAGGKGGGKPPQEPPPPATPNFSIESIGLGGSWSSANAMNNHGDVVGVSDGVNGSGGLYVHIAGSGTFELNRLIANSMLRSPKDLVWGPDIIGDSASELFVASGATNSVVVFDGSTGEAFGDIFERGSGGLLSSPYGLAFRGDDLYVASRGTDQVLRYLGATGFTEVEVFVESGNGLDEPTTFVWGPDANGDGEEDFYVTSRLTHEVLVYDGVDGYEGFDGDDGFIGSLFTPDESVLKWPINMCFGPDDALYISGYGSGNVMCYDFVSETLSPFITADSGLTTPQGLVFDGAGNLYVANGEGGNVLRRDTNGGVSEFVAPGVGGLDNAVGVLFDGNDLLVTSRDTHQVLVYSGPASENQVDCDAFAFIPDVGWVLMSAEDINDSGQIVGSGYPCGAFGQYVSTAYRYTPPQAGERFGTVEGLPVPGPDSARANAINNDGDVVGQFVSEEDGYWHGFLWMHDDPEVFQDLGTFADGGTAALSLTDRIGGHVQVVGVGGNRAWRYDSATGLPLTDLGTLKNDDSGSAQARDINVLGEIVGWADAERSKGNDQTFAFRIVGGDMSSLGSLSSERTWNDSEASAINNYGDVVGSSLFVYPGSRPFLYSDDFGMVDLKDLVPGMPIGLPGDINDAGQICGPRVQNWNGYDSTAYILTPAPPTSE